MVQLVVFPAALSPKSLKEQRMDMITWKQTASSPFVGKRAENHHGSTLAVSRPGFINTDSSAHFTAFAELPETVFLSWRSILIAAPEMSRLLPTAPHPT